MNVKGSIGDIGLIIAILFMFSLFIIVGFKIMDSFNDAYQDQDVSNVSKEYIQDTTDRYPNLFDGMFMFVFVLLVLLLFVSVVTIGTRPEFFFIMVILIAVFIGGSAVVSNAFEDISTATDLNTSTSEFNFMPFIMGELPAVTLVLGFLVLVGLYAKLRGLI